jgi:hypothetical protein
MQLKINDLVMFSADYCGYFNPEKRAGLTFKVTKVFKKECGQDSDAVQLDGINEVHLISVNSLTKVK